jgi:hypothetical protein
MLEVPTHVLDHRDIMLSDHKFSKDFSALKPFYLNNHPVLLNKRYIKIAHISRSIASCGSFKLISQR